MNREQGLEGLHPESMQAWQPKTCTISRMRSLKSGISASKMFQAIYLIHPREEIMSESGIFHGVSGQGVFAGQAAGGWRRERGADE